jgi:tRNA U34 5-methylaminomethyl-2-thiouridine-forming methyltransferase MnmC
VNSIPGHDAFELVHLPSDTYSIRALNNGETFHPVIGPIAEAEALYVNQLKLRERLKNHSGEFVIWDVGLGAAANALTVLRATREMPAPLRLVSFDCTAEPLKFALQHSAKLGYFGGYEPQAAAIIDRHKVQFADGAREVNWQLHIADFPALLTDPAKQPVARPHAILFDAFSPSRNPLMWTLPLFSNLFGMLDPSRPCALATYSRSTMVRVALLLAGFFVGRGHPTGFKEATTAAANVMELLDEPLDRAWLQSAQKSHSAEPLTEAVYRQSPLSSANWNKLRQHPQFK